MGGTAALQTFGNFQANTRAMPLLRSLAEDLARVPIDMALLTELLHCCHRFRVKNPCKVKGGQPHSKTLRADPEQSKIRRVLECGCPLPLLYRCGCPTS